jgi:chemotaxis protein CheX
MSVAEVFRLMLGTECEKLHGVLPSEDETVSAVVGFGGLLSGACLFRAGSSTARLMAGRMTGVRFETLDDTVKDAIGEICNMLAGAWKGRVPELAAHCGLSVPAVITGRDYRLHMQSPEFRFQRLYGFEDARFEVTIVCDGMA